ncbi:MAG: cell division protein ZapA [Syntrophotaleaceae bacterium]
MKQAVQVTILGQQYTVKSEASQHEVLRVAEFVNGQISDVLTSGRSVDTLNTAILALMNLGGAYLRLQENTGSAEQDLRDRLKKLLSRLEKALP